MGVITQLPRGHYGERFARLRVIPRSVTMGLWK